jgi:hypothetical protein
VTTTRATEAKAKSRVLKKTLAMPVRIPKTVGPFAKTTPCPPWTRGTYWAFHQIPASLFCRLSARNYSLTLRKTDTFFLHTKRPAV